MRAGGMGPEACAGASNSDGGGGGGSSGGRGDGSSSSNVGSSAAEGHAGDVYPVVNSSLCGEVTVAGELPGLRRELARGQRRPQGQALRLLSLCLARWLPLCSSLLPRAQGNDAAHSGMLAAGRRMVRLAGLARAAAEARGDARAAESWGRLLGACGSIGEGGEDAAPPQAGDEGGAGPGDVERGFGALAAALVPPCDVGREVLPTCSNPLCTSLEGDSEAGLQLVPCGGMCGGVGCDGTGPCCCSECVRTVQRDGGWRWCGVAEVG